MRQVTFTVGGMTCGACVNTVKKQVGGIPGVVDCQVSLMTNECHVKYKEDECDAAKVVEAVEDCGFECSLAGGPERVLAEGILTVQGMTCGSCVSSVTQQVEKLDGVSRVVVSLMTEECHVEYDASKLSIQDIKGTIDDSGFDATVVSAQQCSQAKVKRATFHIYGVAWDKPVEAVNEEFQALVFDGVQSAEYSQVNGLAIATFSYAQNVCGVRDIAHRISNLGYEGTISSSFDNSTQMKLLAGIKEIQFWRRNCLIASILAILTMSLYMGVPMLIPSFIKHHHFPYRETFFLKGLYYRDVFGWVIATYLQITLGGYFYVAFWKSLKHGTGTMDTLVCTSTTCAYVFSIYSIVLNVVRPSENGKLPNVIFDTSVMLFAFISLGKLLEHRAKSATSTALSKLISLTPSSCMILGPDNEPFEVPIDLLQPGDVVEVMPGKRIPADGIVTEGETEIDESLITGESLPIVKKTGSSVIAGSINGPGHFYFKATGVGDESKLANIIRIMKQAQLSKPPIQRYADFLASIFVPSIMVLTLCTFAMWFVLSNLIADSLPALKSGKGRFYMCFQTAISVVIVACPCALGLAAPTAIMVGTGVGAEHQVLIKGGDIMEKFNNVGKFVFDKTGTLTTGSMSVQNFVLEPSQRLTAEVLACLRACELISEHPVAKAIVGYCAQINQDSNMNAVVLHSKIIVGKGVECLCELQGERHKLLIGKQSLMPAGWNAPEADSPQHGFTLSYLCVDDIVIGKFEITDEVKRDAYDTVNYLIDEGYAVYMVTGDTQGSALKVARQLGIKEEHVFSEVTPSGKSQIVEQLQRNSTDGVVFVGDGINDSPVLVTSDIGVSISTGTDVAMEAADVVILCDGDRTNATLRGLLYALDISRKTFYRVKLNLFWALCYNMFMIPISMGVLLPWGITLPPMAAGFAMAMSSVSVVLSSLALKNWKPEHLHRSRRKHVHQARRSMLSGLFSRHSNPARDDDIELQVRMLQ
ncbi:CCC2 (YDR270W) [Zygosaccharomyces parabailii]|nr:CCC2 (YDR270W) [Zygosaccharomyces parabailii]